MAAFTLPYIPTTITSQTNSWLPRLSAVSPPPTSFRAHILVMEPMLLVMVISVALAKSSLDTDSLFSLDIMLPKLENETGATCDVSCNGEEEEEEEKK